MNALKLGYVYRVLFLDHCEGGVGPMEFEAFGRVVKLTRSTVTLAHWNYPENTKELDDNVSTQNILRAAIKEVTALGPLKG